MEEVSTEYKRTGKIPGFLGTYLTGGVRIIKIGEDFHVIESIKDPFASLGYGYTDFPEVWLVNLREGTVLLRPDEVLPILKEQWNKVLGVTNDLDDSAGVEEATAGMSGQAWDQFNLLTLFGLSPDGKNLGFYLFTRRGGVFDYTAVIGFLNMQTKQPVFTSFTSFDGRENWQPEWSPKGAYIYYGSIQEMVINEGKEVNILHVDSTVTQQRLFSLPSVEMLTILFPEEVKAAKEKYQAPDFGGWLSLDSAILSTINFRPWIDNIEWSADESSFSFTTITERAAMNYVRYLEIRARGRIKEELGWAYWTINADGSGLQLLRTER